MSRRITAKILREEANWLPYAPGEAIEVAYGQRMAELYSRIDELREARAEAVHALALERIGSRHPSLARARAVELEGRDVDAALSEAS